jgi:tripartite-type tricarboxylate transporter receptor subunit TctC
MHSTPRNPNFDRWLRPCFIAAVACAAVFLAAAPAQAQSAGYPQKPVRIIVPYGPGGVGDLTMRLLADKLGDEVKQSFVVENRPGAGGIAAMEAVLHASADGYTLGEMGNGQTISMTLFKTLPYDVLKDFAQVSVAASFEMLLAVPDGSPYKSVKDVVDAARKNSGKLNLGAINPGSTQNLSAYLLQQVTGASFTIVPYRTTPDLVTALLRGDVDVGFDFYAGFESEMGPGKLRIIATSGEQRDPLLKDVPTAVESGFPQYVVTSWNGVAAPAGVPADVVKFLNAHIVHALAAPDLQQKALCLGMQARGSTPEEMHDRMAADITKWRDVIEKAGIPKE